MSIKFATSNDKMSLRKIPYVFTEQGVSMLASVLKNKVAITISIQIIKAFVEMRKFISQNIIHYERFERIEQRLSLHDKNFDKLFEALKDKTKKPSEGVFFDGQIYDAYAFINDLLKSETCSPVNESPLFHSHVLTGRYGQTNQIFKGTYFSCKK